MTEADFYRRHLRPALFNPPLTQIYRVEDYGIPDVLVVAGGETFYLELKVLEQLPTRMGTPFRVKSTVEQRRTMQQINRSAEEGGQTDRAFFLVGVARERVWYLLPADVPTELDMDSLAEWTTDSGGFDELNQLLIFEEVEND